MIGEIYMRNMINKFFRFVACLMIVCFVALNVNAEELSKAAKIEIVESVLSQEGVPESIISKMGTAVKLDMYEKMQQYDLQISDIEEKIVTFNPVQGEEVTTYATIPESRMSITSMYTNYVTGTKIELVECYYYSEWLSGPIVNGTDGLAMNWDSSLFTLRGWAAYPSGLFGTEYANLDVITRAASATQGGYGINIQLHEELDNQSVEMLTTLYPRNTLYTTSDVTSNINYEYGHQKLTATLDVGFSISGVTVNIAPSSSVDTAAETITYHTNKEIVSEDW